MNGFIIIGKDSHLASAFLKIHPKANFLLNRKECDITKPDSIVDALKQSKFKYVLNCAAATDINWCENNPGECMKINTYGPKKVEDACTRLNKKLIQISSDYAKFPVNAYGKSKKQMEKLINKNRSLIIRTSFYYEDYQPLKGLLRNRNITGYSNVFFNPVSNYFLAKQILKHKNEVGLINIFSSTKVSKLDFFKEYCKIFSLDQKLITPKIFKNIKSKLQRPLDSFINPDITVNLNIDLKNFRKYSGL